MYGFRDSSSGKKTELTMMKIFVGSKQNGQD